jgi:hypothetical protein
MPREIDVQLRIVVPDGDEREADLIGDAIFRVLELDQEDDRVADLGLRGLEIGLAFAEDAEND